MKAVEAARYAAAALSAGGAADAEAAEAVRRAHIAAVAALALAEGTFTGLAPAPARLGLLRRLVGMATAMLPAADRPRFREEWTGLLTELPTRRARARQLASILCGAPRLGWVLRRPLGGRRA